MAVAEAQAGADYFWSDSLETVLDGAGEGPEADVLYALEQWLDNVRRHFAEFPYCCDWDDLNLLVINDRSALVDYLVGRLLACEGAARS